MYKLIEYVRNMSLYATTTTSSTTESSNLLNNGSNVLHSGAAPRELDIAVKRHAKYFKRFLELLPGKLALHDSTRYEIILFDYFYYFRKIYYSFIG